MALEQLQNTNPEKVYTPKDFTVDFFALGYFSHAKTMYQTVLQPVYVAKFISNGFSKMGHVITVPAAGTPYESICRKMTPPPFNSQRIEKSVLAIHPKAPGSAPGELLTCTTNRG